jgi:hypothetical protein
VSKKKSKLGFKPLPKTGDRDLDFVDDLINHYEGLEARKAQDALNAQMDADHQVWEEQRMDNWRKEKAWEESRSELAQDIVEEIGRGIDLDKREPWSPTFPDRSKLPWHTLCIPEELQENFEVAVAVHDKATDYEPVPGLVFFGSPAYQEHRRRTIESRKERNKKHESA